MSQSFATILDKSNFLLQSKIQMKHHSLILFFLTSFRWHCNNFLISQKENETATDEIEVISGISWAMSTHQKAFLNCIIFDFGDEIAVFCRILVLIKGSYFLFYSFHMNPNMLLIRDYINRGFYYVIQ